MKRSEVEVGKAYAVGSRSPGSWGWQWTADPYAERVVVVDTGKWYRPGGYSYSGGQQKQTLADGTTVETNARPTTEGIRAEGVLVRHEGGSVVLESLQRILRPWDEHAEIVARERVEEQARRKQQEDAKAARADRLSAIIERLAALGLNVSHYAGSGGSLSLTHTEVETLLDLAEAGTRQ